MLIKVQNIVKRGEMMQKMQMAIVKNYLYLISPVIIIPRGDYEATNNH